MADSERPINRTKPKPIDPPRIGTVGGVVFALAYPLLSICVVGLVRWADAWIFVMHAERLTFIGFYMLFGWMTLECLRMRKLDAKILVAFYCLYFALGVTFWPLLGTPWPSIR